MVRNAGVTEVHLLISCPPTDSPCYYGFDTPSQNELMAANNNIKEIQEFVEADSLAYLSGWLKPTLIQIDEVLLAKTGCC